LKLIVYIRITCTTSCLKI